MGPIGLRLDEFRVDTGTFDCFLEVFLSSKHPEVQGTDALDRVIISGIHLKKIDFDNYMMISPLAHSIEQSISNTFIIKLLYKLFALLYTDYIIMQNTGHLHGICLKIKYVSGTLCLQSIIISRISSTILELCSKNIMFAEHKNFKP